MIANYLLGPARGSETFLTMCMPQIRDSQKTWELARLQATNMVTVELVQGMLKKRKVVRYTLMCKLDSHQKAIMQWLSPEPFNNVHASISKVRQPGTGTWFIDEVHNWLEEEQYPVLWCRGIRKSTRTGIFQTVLTDI